MDDARKTLQVKIVAGYLPEVSDTRKGYFAAIFAAFWNLAK